MNVMNLIFKLVHKFVPMSAEDFTRLRDEAFDWYNGVSVHEDAKKDISYYVKKYSEMWQARLILAISYIFLVRKISDFLNPKEEEEDDDEF